MSEKLGEMTKTVRAYSSEENNASRDKIERNKVGVAAPRLTRGGVDIAE